MFIHLINKGQISVFFEISNRSFITSRQSQSSFTVYWLPFLFSSPFMQGYAKPCPCRLNTAQNKQRPACPLPHYIVPPEKFSHSEMLESIRLSGYCWHRRESWWIRKRWQSQTGKNFPLCSLGERKLPTPRCWLWWEPNPTAAILHSVCKSWCGSSS